MKLEEARSLAEIPVGSFTTELCNEVHQNLMQQMDAFMGIHWLAIFLRKYPNPVPNPEGCAFGFSVGHDPAHQGVYGINNHNVKDRVENGLKWATPMIITAVISEAEYLLSSIGQLHKAKGDKESWYQASVKYFADSTAWVHPNLSRFKDSFLICLDRLSELNRKRNGFVHRRTPSGKKKSTVLNIDDIGQAWLYALYCTVVIDGMFAENQVQQIDSEAK